MHQDRDNKILERLANTIRVLSAEAVQNANSGHPGMPMGSADYASYLWANKMRFNPSDPQWIARDRFVLSAGHGSMLLYSLLYLFGYQVTLDDIKNFRQLNSITPGHPEFGLTEGVEVTTGPLGQGFANSVGLAIAGKILEKKFGDLFKFTVYCIVSDGDLMEGISYEAASLAGHLKLDNLVYIYDDNHISIGGSTSVCFSEDVVNRFQSQGWYVQSIDGHNLDQISNALDLAIAKEGAPSLICAETKIAFGSPHKEGTAESHGAPLGEDEIKAIKDKFNFPLDKEFYIPEEVKKFCQEAVNKKAEYYNKWQEEFQSWQEGNKEKWYELKLFLNKELPSSLERELISLARSIDKPEATRNISGSMIQIIAQQLPNFLGGSADLEPSNKTLIKNSSDMSSNNMLGRNIRFGVREHSMGAIVNGLAYTQAFFPFSATFLVFSDYMRPAIRLAALSHIQSLFIFTHDSFFVGEDGPTHQPIEHITSLRAVPNLYVYRPADALETAVCYWLALNKKDAPSALLFTRQKVTPLQRENENIEDIKKGAYIVAGEDNASVTFVATGSEVSLALDSSRELKSRFNIASRVVSMPCYEIFKEQSKTYQEKVLPHSSTFITIEAGSTLWWKALFNKECLSIGIDHFGKSAPAKDLQKEFGFTVDNIISKVAQWMNLKE